MHANTKSMSNALASQVEISRKKNNMKVNKKKYMMETKKQLGELASSYISEL